MKVPIPAACESIQDEIDSLRQERNELQEELQHAPPSEKPALPRLIRRINLQLGGLREQLDDCIASQPAEPPTLPPIEAILTGTSELTTTYASSPGPYYNHVRFKVLINGERTVITITKFPAISTSFDTPLGTNTTVVTRTGGGTGSYNTGAIVIPIRLHFDHSIDLPGYEEDSDLNLTLSTDPPGSPLTPEPFGNVTLVGSGQFIGGILGGETGTLTVSGTIAEAVPVTVPDVRELYHGYAGSLVFNAGLVPRFTGAIPQGNAWVFSQSPWAGVTASRGDTVTMQLKVGPIP
jgi:hypothetical protein